MLLFSLLRDEIGGSLLDQTFFYFIFFNASIPPGWFSENVGKRGKAKAAEAESAGKIHSGGGKNVESRKIKSRVSPKLAEPKLV